MEITILNEVEIRESVQLNEAAIGAAAEGFTKLAEGKVSLPPIMRIDIHEQNGEVDVKSAYIHGMDSFAIKIAAGFHDNHLLDLPTGSGMMLLISAETGRPLAVLLDNGYLTDVRTGIAGAIAAEHLARSEIKAVGVIGSGMQARFQMRGLKEVRDVYGIVSEEVEQYAEEMAAELGIDVVIEETPQDVVQQSDMVVTTTPSNDPYLKAEWLHPGLHITCMGSDAEHKQEVFPEVFKLADVVVCDRKSQAFRLGELHHAGEAGVITPEKVIELGELTSGSKKGRQEDNQITICDLTGVGVQDTQIARLAYENAVNLGLGMTI
jgi:ornithine cyclodeaminase